MHDLLCETKINKLEVAIRIDEHILGFHVTIRNALVLMEEFEDQHHFRDIEPGGIFTETGCSSEISEDLATRAIVQLSSVSKVSVLLG